MTEDRPIRAALYLRVSTNRQAEHDLSIPDQKRQAEAYCAAKGWQIVAEYVEPGQSATDDSRSVPASAFANAPKFHKGGEVPALLKPGEIVDPGDGSVFAKHFRPPQGGNTYITVETPPGHTAETSRRRSGGDEMVRVMVKAVAKAYGLRTPITPV